MANMKTIWGFAYAFCMFPSGYIGDHMDLRHFLSGRDSNGTLELTVIRYGNQAFLRWLSSQMGENDNFRKKAEFP